MIQIKGPQSEVIGVADSLRNLFPPETEFQVVSAYGRTEVLIPKRELTEERAKEVMAALFANCPYFQLTVFA